MGQKSALSLFSSGGIGDLALRASCIKTIVANELVEERARLFEYNYPETKMIVGDILIKKEEIVNTTLKILNGKRLDFLFATPPCQGMSKNGRGKLLDGVRKGLKPKFDPRNQLVIPTLEIIKELNPLVVVFENVPEMEYTLIESPAGNIINIIDFIKNSLSSYVGQAEVVEFADYGVPQRRQRLITVFTKNKALIEDYKKNKSFLPPRTHSQKGKHGTLPWCTLRDVIGDIPSLDASTKEKSVCELLPYHRVPTLDKSKYFWVKHTPENKSAFDNQCVNPKCLYTMNRIHGASKGADGINRTHEDTPVRCQKCNSLLPRPWVKEGESFRLMKGYTSAYKRMSWDLPASALTCNLSYACSDNKLHPSQNRVLSLHEAFIIHTINEFEYFWQSTNNKKLSDKCIREVVGESIPPKGLEKIFRHLLSFLDEEEISLSFGQYSKTSDELTVLN